MDTSKAEFINKTIKLLNEIELSSSQVESLEWYLSNNLKLFLDSVRATGTAKEIENASKLFDKFCIESMDWDDKLFKRCSELVALGLKISKSMRV